MAEFTTLEDFPRSEKEFNCRFCDEAACLEYLFSMRWPEGFQCSSCGHDEYWKSRRSLYICRRCEHQHSVTAGTIFHRTRKPLLDWFKAIWWFSTQKTSTSAVNLQDQLSLGSYHTAWEWLQKLRACTVLPGREKLRGTVETDEVVIGGEQSGKRGRGAEHKTLIAVAVEREGDKKLGRLRMEVINDASTKSLDSFVLTNITSGSTVKTDGWGGYNHLESLGYVHEKTVQSKTDDKDSVVPGVHLVASLVKRWLLGTFQGRFDQKFLQRYLDEYVFRFNRRKTGTPGKRFWRLLQNAAVTKPLSPFRLRNPGLLEPSA
jgi:hypothetical protein